MKSPFISSVFLILFSALFSIQAQTAGSLDSTFGAGGKVTTDFFGDFDRIFVLRSAIGTSSTAAILHLRDCISA